MVIRSYLTAFLLVAAASRGLASPSRDAGLPFVLDSHGAVIVSVTMQGHGPFPFMLDTGSTHSAISDDIVGQLALRPIGRSMLQTSTGSSAVPVVRVANVEVGEASVPELLASALTRQELQLLGPGVRGVLGQDFLASHHYTIDYGRRRLTWDDLAEHPEPVDETEMTRLPLVEQDGRYVVRMNPANCEAALRLVADSGSSELVLFESSSLAGLEFSAVSGAQPVTLESLTGSRPVRLLRLKRLTVGSLTIRDRLAVVVPAAGPSYSSVDGLLPLHTFSRVSFRPRDGYLLIGR